MSIKMELSEVRYELIKLIGLDEAWTASLDNTNPGIYGIENWNVEIDTHNIWIDIPSRSLTFKDIKFSFGVLLVASGREGFCREFVRTSSGEGKFDFMDDGRNVKLKNIEGVLISACSRENTTEGRVESDSLLFTSCSIQFCSVDESRAMSLCVSCRY